jgi:meromycolic acid enoyl-[acyl-carrier-protein] reductase
MGMLDGKKLLITGVINRESIAFEVARQAQRAGAEVVLTGFGRAKRMTERAAARLPEPPDVLELDVNDPQHLEAVAANLRERWGRVDGVLHAIAFAPEDALGGRFLSTPPESAATAFQTSAYSFKALAAALADLYPEEGASLVAMDFDAQVAWPVYDWMGVAKAALEAVNRYLARDLGPRGVRVNLVSAGPLGTLAARGIPGFSDLAEAWQRQAPLGWDIEDPAPVAGAVLFLLSDLARGVTGEVLHVDGGFHAMGTALVPAGETAAEREPAAAAGETAAQSPPDEAGDAGAPNGRAVAEPAGAG